MAKAGSEQTICRDAALAQSDREMATLYQTAMARLPEMRQNSLRQEQRDWLKQRETQCLKSTSEVDCLKAMYSRRIAELSSLTKEFTDLRYGYAYDFSIVTKNLVDIRVIPKNRVTIYSKATPGVLVYLPAKNIWATKVDHSPVCYETSEIGAEPIPAYGWPGSLAMGEGCYHGVVILTNQPYALTLGSGCAEPSGAFDQVLKSFRLIAPVKAIIADCPNDAVDSIGQWSPY